MGLVLEVDREAPSPDAVGLAASVLDSGGVVVLPTETVYGVAMSPFSSSSAEPLFVLKRRGHDLAIPWLLEDACALRVFAAHLPPEAQKLADRCWPGALTLVVEASDAVPRAYRASDGTVALRVPDLPFVRQVAAACGGALCVTSANTHGFPAPSCLEELEPRIIAGASLVFDGGPARIGAASTIVSCVGHRPTIIRESAIGADEVERILRA
ncbi:MAG: L-threonylcarbamoyladenylate synthase [Actinomycetota bacterium]|nr:L-threonylcarbamoyladenylate synthase [Actinomycetota bacterium]